jgi:hypothetical protein
MKNIITIINWINRIIITYFMIFLVISLFNNEFVVISAYAGFILGICQLTSFFITLFLFKRISKKQITNTVIYISLVTVYFLGYFLLFELFKFSFTQLVFVVIYGLSPIFLSFFWTYIIESIKKEL